MADPPNYRITHSTSSTTIAPLQLDAVTVGADSTKTSTANITATHNNAASNSNKGCAEVVEWEREQDDFVCPLSAQPHKLPQSQTREQRTYEKANCILVASSTHKVARIRDSLSKENDRIMRCMQ